VLDQCRRFGQEAFDLIQGEVGVSEKDRVLGARNLDEARMGDEIRRGSAQLDVD
jgi:hypothetical protein